MPRPEMRILAPFLRFLPISATKSPRTPSICFFGTSCWAARSAARCFSVRTDGVFFAAAFAGAFAGAFFAGAFFLAGGIVDFLYDAVKQEVRVDSRDSRKRK